MLKHLLLADSDPETLSILRDTLATEYYISVAEDGKSAYEAACTIKPDCVIFDVDMMPTSGTLMYARMRRNPELRHIPAIVYSHIAPRYGTGIRLVSKKTGTGPLVQALREVMAARPGIAS